MKAWYVSGIKFGWGYKETPSFSSNITVTPAMKNNGSVYAHTFFAMPGVTIGKLSIRFASDAQWGSFEAIDVLHRVLCTVF
jgi:hypothetical protein